ncbi:hypothetical protein [Nostoc sp.]
MMIKVKQARMLRAIALVYLKLGKLFVDQPINGRKTSKGGNTTTL